MKCLTLTFFTLGICHLLFSAESVPVIVDIMNSDFDEYDEGWRMGVCAQDPSNGHIPIAWSWYGHQRPTNIKPKNGTATPEGIQAEEVATDNFWWTQLHDGQSSSLVSPNITLKQGSYIKFKTAVDEIKPADATTPSPTPSSVSAAIVVSVKHVSETPCQEDETNITSFKLPLSKDWTSLHEYKIPREYVNVVIILTASANIPDSDQTLFLEIAVDDFLLVSQFESTAATTTTTISTPTTTKSLQTTTLVAETTTAGSSPLRTKLFDNLTIFALVLTYLAMKT